ncbi:MAG: GNAT family N-acetyltransferase [Desulfovibrionaceae bacterium]
MDTLVEQFRKFNRFHTNLLGLLRRRLLDSPLGLAEARTLFEIRAAPGTSAVELSELLGMDRGQLSRILGRLHKAGLIVREGRPSGRRPVPLRPTATGNALLRAIDDSADRQAEKLLSPLNERERTRLDTALTEVQNLLGKTRTPEGETVIRPARLGDLAWVVEKHAAVYAEEHGFNADFERHIVLGLAAFLREESRPRSALFLAENDLRRTGCVGIHEAEPELAMLRWLLVLPEARGTGAGRALVERAVAFSRLNGYSRIFLLTLSHLEAARKLYASFGFIRVDGNPVVMGGRRVMEERWELALR